MTRADQRLRSRLGIPFALCLLVTTGCGDDAPARSSTPPPGGSGGAAGAIGSGGAPAGNGGSVSGSGGSVSGTGGAVGTGGQLGGSDAGADAAMDGSMADDGGSMEGGDGGNPACSATMDCIDDDGCCPDACGMVTDNDCTATCGDDKVEQGELCDGNCPDLEDCDDAVACTIDTVAGSAATCDAVCEHEDIESCTDDDGCCAPGCNSANDNDCSETCGDGILDDGETCDGDCPTDCDDGNACTRNAIVGEVANCTAQCSVDPIQSCVDGDGCCAPGCTSLADSDCPVKCGNGVVEDGERCDTNCPTSCGDGNACTTDTLTGTPSNCDVQCIHQAITSCINGDGCCPGSCNANNDDDCVPTCGNGVVEGTEKCDGNSCPTSVADCDDSRKCTTDTFSGTGCGRECTHTDITACVNGDGCCPGSCNSNNDNDCSDTCGNGAVEGTETCDGNCPTSCDDGDPCTSDILSGQADQCNVECSHSPITTCTNGDMCCPVGCNANNDDSCDPVCPNGTVEPPTEKCDGNCPTSCDDGDACTNDSLTGSAAQCTAECTTTAVTSCNLSSADQCCPGNCTIDNDEDCARNECLTQADGRGEDPNDPCIICGCVNCRDELDLCFNGNPNVPNDVAAGGPAAGTPKSELCAAVVFCGKDNNCTGTDCYGLLSPGPCRPEIEAAAESTNLFTILGRQTNTTYAVGRANAVGDCTDNDCAGLCTN